MAGRIAALDLPNLVVMEGGYAVDALGANVASFLEDSMIRILLAALCLFATSPAAAQEERWAVHAGGQTPILLSSTRAGCRRLDRQEDPPRSLLRVGGQRDAALHLFRCDGADGDAGFCESAPSRTC